jgi:hypothetical protein
MMVAIAGSSAMRGLAGKDRLDRVDNGLHALQEKGERP